eukprot:superscaffoldBa00010945_g24966
MSQHRIRPKEAPARVGGPPGSPSEKMDPLSVFFVIHNLPVWLLALSPSDKKCFEDMAKADKVRYNREMRDYVPPKGFGKRGRKRKDPNAPKRP